MKTKHTPGEWLRWTGKKWILHTAGNPRVVIDDSVGAENYARLIAAAPELLEALKLVLKVTTHSTAKKVIEDAIAKAEGRE